MWTVFEMNEATDRPIDRRTDVPGRTTAHKLATVPSFLLREFVCIRYRQQLHYKLTPFCGPQLEERKQRGEHANLQSATAANVLIATK